MKSDVFTLDEDGSVVLVDNKDIYIRLDKISIESLGVGGEPMTNFVFTAINHTDEYYDVAFYDIAINGWMAGTCAACWLEPGETETEVTQLTYSNYNYTHYDLNYCGVTEVTDARFTLSYGEDDLSIEKCTNADCTVYANGVTAETVSRNERRTAPNETVIIDNDEFSLIAIEYEQHDAEYILSWLDPYCTVTAYIENKTDYVIDFLWIGETVNGSGVDSEIADMVLQPHSRGYITFFFNTARIHNDDSFSLNNVTGYIYAYKIIPGTTTEKGTVIDGDYTINLA